MPQAISSTAIASTTANYDNSAGRSRFARGKLHADGARRLALHRTATVGVAVDAVVTRPIIEIRIGR